MKRLLFVVPVLAVLAVDAKTVAYWPMSKVTVDGVDKVRCAVSPQNDLLVNEPAVVFSDNDIGWNLPPNPDTTGAAALAGGFLVDQKMTVANPSRVGVLASDCASLASSLSAGRDFTVEGWAKFTALPGSGSEKVIVYNTLAEPGGWMWSLNRKEDSDTLRIYVELHDDYDYRHLYLAEDLTDAEIKDAWHHYALAYQQATGVWSFYLDGVLRDSGRAPKEKFDTVPTSFHNPKICFFGAGSSVAKSLIGDATCWRVSDRKLDASGLLYGSGTGSVVPYPAATKTLAYWKLDNTDEGFADSVGNLDLTGCAGVIKDVDAAVVRNPDSTVTFRGDSGENNGSVITGTAYNQDNRYLYVTGSSIVKPCFRGAEGWTFECYVKRTGDHGDQYGTLLNICFSENCADPLFQLRVFGADDASVKYGIWDNKAFAKNTFENNNFCTGEGLLPEDAWTHVALTVSYEMVENVQQVVYRLYENGVLKGSQMAERKLSSLANISSVSFGGIAAGHPWDARAIAGALDSIRLSKGALNPSEFLCAAGEPISVSNLAYWPLDDRNGLAEGGVSVGFPGYSFDQIKGTVVGDSERARTKVSTEGLPRANAGSVVVSADGSFGVSHLGSDLNFGATWSVEGYRKIVGSAVTDVCGTYDAVLGKGWKLVCDLSGSVPVFRIFAAAGDEPFVDAAFEGVGNFNADGWNHLLLTHDRSGTWVLTVNGGVAGTITSSPRCSVVTSGVTGFHVAGGQYDLWRATTGILPFADSLYSEKAGLVILLK